MSGYTARFDWYSATFEQLDDGRIPAALAVALGGTISWARGHVGYSRLATIERGDETLARVMSGSSRLGEVHVTVSGDACDQVVPLLRRLWPAHRVARADSAIDFRSEFEVLDALALEFAKDHGLVYRLVTDSEGGATRYLGSVNSDVMVRVYKKSEQLRKMHPERAYEVPDGIVRVELQARPPSRIKGAVASMTAEELWGLGEWTRDFAIEFLDVDAERVSTHFRRPTDWARSLHWMGQQYGPVVRRRAQEVGAEVALAEVLRALGMGASELVLVGGDHDG